jgi:hypothetical protein
MTVEPIMSNRLNPLMKIAMQKFFTTPLLYLAAAATAAAQSPPPPAEVAGEPISTLMLFTLGTALVLGIGGLVWFLRKRSNRDAADRALNPNNPRNQ